MHECTTHAGDLPYKSVLNLIEFGKDNYAWINFPGYTIEIGLVTCLCSTYTPHWWLLYLGLHEFDMRTWREKQANKKKQLEMWDYMCKST